MSDLLDVNAGDEAYQSSSSGDDSDQSTKSRKSKATRKKHVKLAGNVSKGAQDSVMSPSSGKALSVLSVAKRIMQT